MSYDIQVEERATTPIASVRKEIDQSEIGRWIDEAVGRIFPALGAAGVVPSGPMVCRYHTWRDGRTLCEVGIPVQGSVPDGIDASELPGGRSATVVHVGQYDDLSKAYDALSAWMEESDESAGVGPYEIYLNDPRSTPAENLETKVIWPLA